MKKLLALLLFAFIAYSAAAQDNKKMLVSPVSTAWYKQLLSYPMSEKLTLTGRIWRHNGIGPVFRYSLAHAGQTLFAMPCYSSELRQKMIIIGFRFKL